MVEEMPDNKNEIKKDTKPKITTEEKKIGEYIERIDFSSDPNIYLFYRHINTGLLAFANQMQNADESFTKYKVMLRLAEGFLSSKYGIDFYAVRRKIREVSKDETEALEKEVQLIGQILDVRTRKVEVNLIWKKNIKDNDESDEDNDILIDEEDQDEFTQDITINNMINKIIKKDENDDSPSDT